MWDRFVALSAVRKLINQYVPIHYRTIAGLAGVAAAVAGFRGEAMHGFDEWYGGDIRIGVVDISAAGRPGNKSLLYEFVFDRKKLASAITTDRQVAALVSRGAPAIVKSGCRVTIGSRPMDILPIVVIAQNSGDRTAKQYEVMISFSSKDEDIPDPGIRILGISKDDLDVVYLYQQETDDTISNALRACKSDAIQTYLSDMTQQKSAGDADKEAMPAPKIPELTRDMYRSLGLTRDTIFLNGTLEAHEFQIATMIIAVPAQVSDFATIFQVDCEDCTFFYKTNSYGQHIRVDRPAQVVSLP